MPTITKRITPFLWFDKQAEEAVNHYISVFPNSRILHTTRFPDAIAEVSGQPSGSVMTLAFQLDSQDLIAFNGGPYFKFSGAISFMVHCETQADVDHYWNQLSAGGDPKAQQCGWLQDKFGVTWQIVPTILDKLLTDPDPAKARRATAAMLKMIKLDIATLQQAAAGQ